MTQERCTVIMVIRDRFSTTERCVDELFRNTPEPFDLIIVAGGAPKGVESSLKARFGGKADLVFEPELLNPAESRNLGLRRARTRLAVVMDNDVLVMPGWLPAGSNRTSVRLRFGL